ncbi:MAG: acyl carrier protein [Rhodocyclaceae bacterium]|nr:acyl carrier protein [Rhodocyclaceae bacterium]
MNTSEKLELVADLLSVSPTDITPETPLKSLDTWDSMAALSLVILLEEQFGRADVGGSEIKRLESVADILDLMNAPQST